MNQGCGVEGEVHCVENEQEKVEQTEQTFSKRLYDVYRYEPHFQSAR